jgi:hypothetical protein
MKIYLSTVIARRFAIDNAILVVELTIPILQIDTSSTSAFINDDIICTNQGGKKVRQTTTSEIAKFTTKYVVGVFE